MGLHLHGRPTLVGEESQVDSPLGGRPPPLWKVEFPPLVGGKVSHHMEGFGFGSYSKTWTPTLGIHLYIEGQGEGAGHTKATSLAAPHSGRPPPLPKP